MEPRSATLPPTAADLPAADVLPVDVLAAVADGVAVVDDAGRFVDVNPAGARLCGSTREQLLGTGCPFAPQLPPESGEPPAVVRVERTVSIEPAPGTRRDLSCIAVRLPGRAAWVVSFRDVTERRRAERRLSAIASAAGRVAATRSLPGTLEALAHEIVLAEGCVAVQVLTLNPAGDRFEVMGAAGFEHAPDFFDRLQECADRGARLATLSAFAQRRPVVVPERYTTIMTDPAWEPLRALMSSPRWADFVSLPLLTRSVPVGVLNVYLAPGQVTGSTELSFLEAMAEQAALAVENARLLDRQGELARREERQRLARDLHDSVVQQVFSMSMQATSLAVLARRPEPPDPPAVARVADDLAAVAQAVLADLRGMVVELRPVQAADRDLGAVLRVLADITTARTGIQVLLAVHDPAGRLAHADPDLLEDVHRIVSEAVHNAVKHAGPSSVAVSVAVDGSGHRITVEVVDDGCGITRPVPTRPAGAGSSGYGVQAMRERVARWTGDLTVGPAPDGGTRVRAVVHAPSATRGALQAPDPNWTVTP